MIMIVFCILIVATIALDNGLGKTPPMGWNSWNRFHCDINETLIKETVDLLISTGLADKGYKYVNLDDCWQIDRNKTTNQIIANKATFPSGMAALGEYIHQKGLLYGLYSDAGFKTCAGFPGGLNHEQIDAITYAKWKVDYLKYDNCNTDGSSGRQRYPVMRDALNASGRHIFFSMCSWGTENVWEWAMPVGNSWRTTDDISPSYQSFLQILEKQRGLSKYAGVGGWNDPDMLEVGNGLMTYNQYQSHFAFWAALKSPLLIGCNLKGITKQTLTILGNEQVIAINQDPLGKQVDLRYEEFIDGYHHQIWGGQLSNNRYVLICFNRGDLDSICSLDFETLFPGQKVTAIREVIDHKDIQIPSDSTFKTKVVQSHAVGVYIFTFKK